MKEIAKVNINETEIFPYPEYVLSVRGTDATPQIHIRHNNISLTVPLTATDTNSSHLITNLNQWLSQQCKIQPKITNKENILSTWIQLRNCNITEE